MNEIPLGWEPENLTPPPEIEKRLMACTNGRGGIIIQGNATLLALTLGDDDVGDAKKAMNEARLIIEATEPIDMRTGVDSALARVVKVFGAAKAHHAGSVAVTALSPVEPGYRVPFKRPASRTSLLRTRLGHESRRSAPS